MPTNLSASRWTRRASRHPYGPGPRADRCFRRPVAPFLAYALGSVPELAGVLAAALVNATLNGRGSL